MNPPTCSSDATRLSASAHAPGSAQEARPATNGKPARPARKARKATLAVSFAAVQLRAPHVKRGIPLKKPPGKLTRLVANMEWALEDLPGVHDIVEYETRLNYVLPKYDDAVC